MISEYILDHESKPNFKLLLKKGIAIDEEELQEKKKDNIDDSLEEGEIENNNDNNNQKKENNNDAVSSNSSSSSNSLTSDTDSKESYKDTSKKTHRHFDGKGLPPKLHPRKKCSGSNSKRKVSAPFFSSTKRSTRI